MIQEYLNRHGGAELQKKLKIHSKTWEKLYIQEIPPNKKTFEKITKYLCIDRPEKYYEIQREFFNICLSTIQEPNELSYEVLIEPKAAPRPRLSARGPFGSIYMPSEYTVWKRKFSDKLGNIGTIVGPVRILAEYHFAAPSNKALGPHLGNKDIDNLDKSLLDALQLNGLIENDKFVYEMSSAKFYSYQNMIQFTIFFCERIENEKGVV